MTLISAVTVGSGGAASIDFTSIPSTYTDLCLKLSTKTASGGEWLFININGSSANVSGRYLYGDGASASSGTVSAGTLVSPSSPTSWTGFSNNEFYFPNYAGSTYKSISVDGVNENNASAADAMLTALLWSNTSAINQITILAQSQNLAQYSTAYLYGVKNA
jgi:hypothetical protein